jgi:hypothetical protein
MLTTVLLIVIYNIKLEQSDVAAAPADPAAAESNKEFFVFVSEPGSKLRQNFFQQTIHKKLPCGSTR